MDGNSMMSVWIWTDWTSQWREVMIDPAKISTAIRYDRTRTRVRIDGEWMLIRLSIDEVLMMKQNAQTGN